MGISALIERERAFFPSAYLNHYQQRWPRNILGVGPIPSHKPRQGGHTHIEISSFYYTALVWLQIFESILTVGVRVFTNGGPKNSCLVIKSCSIMEKGDSNHLSKLRKQVRHGLHRSNRRSTESAFAGLGSLCNYSVDGLRPPQSGYVTSRTDGSRYLVGQWSIKYLT